MRRLAVVALFGVLAVGLAGCLVGGEPTDGAETDAQLEPQANETPAPSNVSTENEGTNTSTDASKNDTGPSDVPDDTNGTDTNQTPTEPEPIQLPGNLTMEGAEELERTDEKVRFRWQGTISPDEPEATEARTTFDVPADVPLRINATLSWSQRSDLDLFVDGEGVRSYCSSTGPDGASEGGQETCQLRTMARSSWDRWGTTVRATAFGIDAPARPANFTVELGLEVAEPWEGPPLEAPEPSPNALQDPGWSAIQDAQIRPGVKVDPIGLGLEAGTANFVFSDPSNRTFYVGWVSHGVVGMQPGETVRFPEAGVDATLVYCSWGTIEETVTCPLLELTEHPRLFNDFALLRLPLEARSTVHPAVLGWGGPNGLGLPPDANTPLIGLGNTPARDAGQPGVNAQDLLVGPTVSSTNIKTEADLAPQPLPGDSGSPVLQESGKTVGVVSAIDVPVASGDPSQAFPPDPGNGNTVIPNLDHALVSLHQETGLEVELKTWPLFETPRAGDLAGPTGSP